MTGVEDQIAALQRRVSALEKGRQQSSEENTPNYLTTKADGSVGALFTGGVQIPEGASATYVPANALGFVDAGGVAREFILGDRPVPTTHALALFSFANAANNATLALQSSEAGAANSAFVTATAIDATTGVTASAVIISSEAFSRFLQGSASSQLSTTGTATLTWPGAALFSNTLNVKLPGAAGVVQMVGTPENQLGLGIGLMAAPDGAGGSNVQGFASAAPGAGATDVFAFLQWGS